VGVAEQGTAFSVLSDGVTLSGDDGAAGPAVMLLHGLTATRRYVVMGSRLLERAGYRVVAYDARGHGRSTAAPLRTAYGYEHLAADLQAVLDVLGLERAVLAGASMGAHTAIRFALAHPERVRALCLITPSYDPALRRTAESFAGWDALAEGLRAGGVEGFVRAYDLAAVPVAWRETIEKVLRRRLAAHEHPEAVADALEVVPRSRPFAGMTDLEGITAPTVVVASRDEADSGHPLAVGERYAAAIPGARLVVEREGSPIAWQGGRLSRVLLDLAEPAREQGPSRYMR
jgi:pimeloyl-ACP methyl ester carboxylesterase